MFQNHGILEDCGRAVFLLLQPSHKTEQLVQSSSQ